MSFLPRTWKSLSSEITLVYASLSVVLVVLLSYIAYQMNASVLEERIREELLSTVDQTLRGINTQIEERIREVQLITLTPAIRDAALAGARRTERLRLEEQPEETVAARLGTRTGMEPSREASRFLADMKRNHPYIAEVFVTDRYGIVAAASNPTSDLRQDDEAWWHQASIQRYYLSNIEYDASAGSYAYAIALPIHDGPGPPLGIVKAAINFKAIQQLANSVRIGNGGRLVVISGDGRVISHPDPQQLFRPTDDVTDLADVADLLASSPRGVRDYSPAGGSGGRMMVGYSRLMRPASLGPLNWTAAAIVSRSEVVAPIDAVRASAILAGLAFIIAAVPIAGAVSRRLSRPLVDLAHRADRISQGDLDVSLAVPSSNEIGRLASAMGSMVENLKTSHRRTLDINAGLERTVRERTDELQRKNRQIETQNKKVMEASRLKSQFLANMSHELRTPLNAVLALSEILSNEMSGPLNEEQIKQVSIINRSGRSLLKLINDVLDLSKIEAGRMSVEKAPMSLRTLVTLIVDTLRPLAEDKSLTLTSVMKPGLPEFMSSDENKLRQILINLVGNGIKFTERGGVRLEVGFSKEPPMIVFDIVDSGIGIPADATDRIFDEFCQADGSTTRRYGGTGLGLTISRKMAELMGGTLTVVSTAEGGSTFTLTVPYVPAPPVPATATEMLRRVRMQVPEPSLMATGDDSAMLQNDSRPIVLVVEDELDNLYVMKKYLNRHGCNVVFARDGNEVLHKARKYRPIAITLDLVLPRKSGWDVLSELKTDPETRNIPVIVASVLDNQERGFCLGAYRYLVKPINEMDLADTISQIQAAARKDARRVLVIDDNVVDSDLIARLLEENNYDVLRAARGDEGIATAVRENPDLIMLDLSLPGMDGFQVMDALRQKEQTRGTPIVIYTAMDLSAGDRARIDRGAQRVFLKNPLEPARILSEIGELLESRAAGRQDPVAAHGTSPEPDPWSRAAQAVEAAAREAATVMAGPAPPPPEVHGKRVLLVEDDPANQYTLEFLLKNEGYQVHIAENGREAIQKTELLRPDVVLMDMMMPVMGGHEATRVLKDTPAVADIPVIALTAAAMTGDREKALAAGCDDYVSKPVNQRLLFERIEHWIARGREAKEKAERLRAEKNFSADPCP